MSQTYNPTNYPGHPKPNGKGVRGFPLPRNWDSGFCVFIPNKMTMFLELMQATSCQGCPAVHGSARSVPDNEPKDAGKAG